MTRKFTAGVVGIFLLLLIIHTVALEILLHKTDASLADAAIRLLRSQILWADTIALAVALVAVLWAAGNIPSRLQRMVRFSHKLGEGDFAARIDSSSRDELAVVEHALDESAANLGLNYADVESRRVELVAILDAMQEAVVTITSQGVVRWTNAAMKRIAGNSVRAGLPLAYSVRDPEVLACMACIQERREVCFGRASLLVPGRIFEINATPMTNGGAVIVLHDVTNLDAAEKSRRDFVANVSHELRTPLTSIQGYVETLLEEPMPNAETTREFLGIIHKNASRMNRLTEDLLALASIEGPDYKLALQTMSAGTLLRDALDLLKGMVADSDVWIQTAETTDALVQADPYAMNQVLGNLVENALKYAGVGGRVRVSARELGDEVEFAVQDFGPGIASEHIERIFERFYRVDKARSRESGGTGLGLAIVKHIILAHNGRVWAESELGAGVTFRFTLPKVSVVS